MVSGRFAGVALALALGSHASAAQGADPFFRHVVGDVVSSKLTPDGSRVVFLADLEFDEVFELFSAPTDGSAPPVQLNAPLVTHGDVQDRYTISPDGSHVAWLADGTTNTIDELYCAPVDGSAPAVRASASITLEFVIGFVFTPDSTRLVAETRTSAGGNELWCVALDGSSPVKVSGSMVTGGNPLGVYFVSPDSTRLVYLADAVTDGLPEIFSAPLDGTGPVVKLNPTPVANGNIAEFVLTPDGTRVVYRADQDTNDVIALYSVPIDGSAAAIRISLPPGPLTNVEPRFAFTAAGDVVYRADHHEENCSGLYRVPVDGSAPAVRLNGPLDPDEDCDDFVIAGANVVYRSDQDANNVLELYTVPLDGSQTTIKLSGTMQPLGDVQPAYAVSPDGTRVVYRADQDADELFELYGAPLDGSSPAVKLNPAPAVNRDVERGTPFDPTGTRVLFLVDTDLSGTGLYSVPPDGSAPAVRLNPVGFAFRPSDDGAREFAAGGRVVYRGVLDPIDPDRVEELFSVPLDGSGAPLALHPPMAQGQLDGDILSFAPTDDGASIVYVAREKLSRGLYIALIGDPSSAVRLTGHDNLQQGFVLGADSQRAALVIFAVPTSNHELYTIPLDGSGPPVRVSGTMVDSGGVELGFAFTPDAQRVVYRADADEPNRFELFSAPADGSGMPVKLSGTLVAGGDVTSFLVSSDSARVVYLADQDLDTRPELYSAPVDGSSAPVRLNGTLPLSCQVRDDYRISPDGTHVFYRADESVLTAAELRVVPIDGSSASVMLNGTLPTGGLVEDFRLSASGALVVYRARQDVNFRIDLYAVPADGSSASVKLDGTLVNGGNVGDYAVTGDGAHVVFGADLAVNDRFEVFTVPSDASAAPQRVHPALTGNFDAGLLALTPDGTRVLYRLSNGPGSPNDVYSTPRDASSAPVLLNGPLVQGRNTAGWLITPDGATAVYASDEEVDNRQELYRVPTDGSAPRTKISGFMAVGGNVETGTLRLSQDGTRVFFIADSQVNEVYELFQFALESGGLLRGSGGLGGRLPTRVHPPLTDTRAHDRAGAPGSSVSRPAGS